MKKKKIYVTPQAHAHEIENILYQAFSVRQKTDTGENIVDIGPVIEDKDPDGNTDFGWFDRQENWGGD